MELNNKYTCPACGYKVFTNTVGSDDICPICFWHDDSIDLAAMYDPLGPNKVSLEQAQKNFSEFGAIEERLREHVRRPTKADQIDSAWRPLNITIDKPRDIPPYSTNPKEIYYWYWNNI